MLIAAGVAESPQLAECLAGEGREVLEASSQAAVLALLGTQPLALMVAAGRNAARWCESIRAGHGGREVPILALVDPGDAAGVRRAGEAGASDFVARPLDASLLVERVRLLVRGAERRAALRRDHERLESAQRLARSGSFAVDLASGAVEAQGFLFGRAVAADEPERVWARRAVEREEQLPGL